jgi:hypothetical protein
VKSRVQISALVVGVALTGAASSVAQTPANAPVDASDLRALAWDSSVQLERDGRVSDARALLLRAWGPTPEGYEVTVRIAWLSARLKDHPRAAAYYQRARAMPGAGPEANRGLSNSLIAMGYDKLQDMDRDNAERLFQQAKLADPSNEAPQRALATVQSMPLIEPEAWAGYVQKPAQQGPKWTGSAFFGHVPWHVTGSLTLRAAFRRVELSRSIDVPVAGPPAFPGGFPSVTARSLTEGWHQSELYAGLDWEKKWFALEALGLGIFPSDQKSAWGTSGRARVGRTGGLNLEGIILHRQGGWMGQVFPTLYWWPSASVGLAVGPRVTRDTQGTEASAVAGITVRNARASLSLGGHYGTERWPVTMATPSVLTLSEDLRYGANASVIVSVSKTVRLGLQGQLERMSLAGTNATYATVSAGIQFAPRF